MRTLRLSATNTTVRVLGGPAAFRARVFAAACHRSRRNHSDVCPSDPAIAAAGKALAAVVTKNCVNAAQPVFLCSQTGERPSCFTFHCQGRESFLRPSAWTARCA